jgi:hypothetical protein
MHIKSIVHKSIAMNSLKKHYFLAGFKPGSSGPEANAMSTAPRRHQGVLSVKLSVVFFQ